MGHSDALKAMACGPRLTRSATLAAALFLVLAPVYACRDEPTSLAGEAHVIVNFSPAAGGKFTANFNGQKFTAGGWHAVNLPSLSTYDVTGSFTGNSLGVKFATSTAAGVESGSVTSVAGPAPILSECGIIYVATTSGSHQFQLRFKATGTTGLVCQ